MSLIGAIDRRIIAAWLGATGGTDSPSPDLPPSVVIAPSISGVGYVDHTLTANRGTWSRNPTSYSYQWVRSDSPIPNATSSTYRVQIEDEGHPIRCLVTASNSGGNTTAPSNIIHHWTPNQLLNLPHVWVDFRDYRLINESDGVISSISNKGLTTGNFSQSDPDLRPVIGEWNGFQCGDFVTQSGIAYLQGSNLIRDLSRNRQVLESYATCRADVVTDVWTNTVFAYDAGVQGIRHALRVSESVGSPTHHNNIALGVRRSDSDPYQTVVQYLEGLEGTEIMLGGRAHHGTNRGMLWFNGNLEINTLLSIDSGVTTNSSSREVTIGGRIVNSVDHQFRGVIGEIINFFDRDVSDEDIDRVFGYFAWRWHLSNSLPSDHPYRNSPPGVQS